MAVEITTTTTSTTTLSKIEEDFDFVYENLHETYKKRKKRPVLQSLD